MARISLPHKRDYETIRAWLLEHKHLSIEELSRLSCLSVNKLREWKIQCNVVNPHTEGDLLKILLEYKKHTADEICILLEISLRTLNACMKKHGIKEPVRRNYRAVNIEKYRPQTKQEWEELYQKHGAVTIRKITGLSTERIYKILDKYNIPRKRNESLISTHKCNNREWLMKHYVENDLSYEECGELANVNQCTIREWLIKNKILPKQCFILPPSTTEQNQSEK